MAPRKEIAKRRQWFDLQIATLRRRGCPREIVTALVAQEKVVVEHASGVQLGETALPFVPAIPREILSLSEQMEMLWGRGVVDYVGLKPELIRELVKTPSVPYYIFDVWVDDSRGSVTPREAAKGIKELGRRGLVPVEAIALAIQREVLSDGCVVALGSRYGTDCVPDLFVHFGRPRLGYTHLGAYQPGRGMASCALM